MSLFIDAHHHIYDLTGMPAGYPGRRGPAQKTAFGTDAELRKDYTHEMYRADLAAMGGRASVHIEAGRNPEDPVEESRWLSGLADEVGIPTALVAYADLARDDAASVLERHAACRRVRGIRQIVTNSGGLAKLQPEDSLYTREAWLRTVPLLRRFGMSFEMQAPPTVAAVAADVARNNPDVTFVLLQCGHPIERSEDALALWRAGLALLGACPNVYVKLSGFYMMNPRETVEGVRSIIDQVVDAFGPHRCMMASNFPVDRLFIDGGGMRATFDRALAGYSPAERAGMLGGTASRVYRLDELMDQGQRRSGDADHAEP